MSKLIIKILSILTFAILLYRWINRLERLSRGSTIRQAPKNQAIRKPADSKRWKSRARRIFISHSWRLSSRDYKELASKLRSVHLVYDHSIPKRKKRIVRSEEELRDIFRKQLLWCSKVFVLADKDLPANGHVAMELDVAAELGKEIIAIQPNDQWAVPDFIRQRAHHIIANNTKSLLSCLSR
jgi:hypothetical protein